MSLADWIQLKLLQRNMSQADLARKSLVSKSTISDLIKRGHVPAPASVVALAVALEENPIVALEAAGLIHLDDIPKDIPANQRQLFLEVALLSPAQRELVLSQLQAAVDWAKKQS